MTASGLPSDDAPFEKLQALETLLSTSHDTSVFEELQVFSAQLKKQKQAIFGAPNALLSRPIECQAAREKGIWAEIEDDFGLLQGDIIFTSAAYFMGKRLEGGYFALANATCDLVPNRREYMALPPVRAIYAPTSADDGKRVKSLLGELLAFKSVQRKYLPPLPGDETTVIARFVDFNRMAQVDAIDVAVAERVASLSLIGWRIFGVHLRRILTRTGDSEVALRKGWS